MDSKILDMRGSWAAHLIYIPSCGSQPIPTCVLFSSTDGPPKASLLMIPLALKGRFVLTALVTIGIVWWAVLNATPAVKSYLVWFWFNDLPPLAGVTRIYIYLGLFLTAMLSTYA